MKDEERSHHDTYFQEELNSLKVSVARIASVLEQALRNAYDESPSNRPVTFVQTQTATQLEEMVGE
jgi:hypothetical protein